MFKLQKLQSMNIRLKHVKSFRKAVMENKFQSFFFLVRSASKEMHVYKFIHMHLSIYAYG